MTLEVLTSAEAERRQRRIAGGLLGRGLVAGDRVALVGSSGAALLCAALGALRIGVVPVLTHAGLLPAERAELLDDAAPALILDDEAVAALESGPPAELAPWPLARPMHYTSGTTGRAKGVWSGVLDESDAAALLGEETALWGFDESDVHLVCSPLYHSVAVRWAGATLLSGGTVLLPGAFDATRVAKVIDTHAPTTTFMVPAHLQRLFSLEDLPPLDRFRLVAHAGSACPEPIKRRAIELFGVGPLWEFYGSTEGQFSAASAAEWLERPGTVGRARAGRTLSVDADGTVWCEVPSWGRFEYWRSPAATAAAWRPARQDPSAWGAFSVGDLGRLDDGGYLYLDGRREDLVITGGVNVYPAEVERVLSQAPGVDEIAVFGRDDEHWGQRVCAAVVGEVDVATLEAYAREHLAGHKRPKEYHRVAALPYTATGKLRRSVLDEEIGASD